MFKVVCERQAIKSIRFQSTYVIPNKQMGVVFESYGGPLIYKEIPVPKPKPNEILINVKYSGVCHSDLHAWRGDWPEKTILPLVGGHEGAGIVVAKGAEVTSFEIGDYAGIKWVNSACMSCEFCQQEAEPCCPNRVVSGYSHNGSFQQYATADAIQAAHISKHADLAAVAPILCAGVTVYKALKVANLLAGQWVAISGAGGGLGTVAIQYAKAMGLRVIAIDTGDDKGQLCKSLGAEIYVDYKKSKKFVDEVVCVTNGGAHGVLNVSVSEAAITQSCEYARILGKVILIGLPAGAKLITPIFDAVGKCIEIKASAVGNRRDTAEALDFFNRGLVKSPITLKGLSELPEVFQQMVDGKILGRIVLDTSKLISVEFYVGARKQT